MHNKMHVYFLNYTLQIKFIFCHYFLHLWIIISVSACVWGFLAPSLSSCSSLLFSSGCGSQRRQGKSAHTAERPAVTEHDRRSTQKECVCLDASVQTPAQWKPGRIKRIVNRNTRLCLCTRYLWIWWKGVYVQPPQNEKAVCDIID